MFIYDYLRPWYICYYRFIESHLHICVVTSSFDRVNWENTVSHVW